MHATCQDLLAEYQELDHFCTTLTPQEWQRPGPFFGWSVWDQIAHLSYLDETALCSVTDPDAFARGAIELTRRMASGEEISALARAQYGHLAGPELLAFWRTRYTQLVGALARLEPRARLRWYGPSMSARSFATARLMETWAHGQDAWDMAGRRRPGSLRLRHIAHIGVTTFGWTFVNRGLPVPQPLPSVALTAPDGACWTWGDPASSNSVRGLAEDFCLVVTQRRHLQDTALVVQGEAATRWLSFAQCFAGAPANPPSPGQRKVVYGAP